MMNTVWRVTTLEAQHGGILPMQAGDRIIPCKGCGEKVLAPPQAAFEGAYCEVCTAAYLSS
jgi:hypothetical protein